MDRPFLVNVDEADSSFTWPRLIYSALRAPTYHLYFEIVLILGIVWLLFKRSYRIKDQVQLTDAEKRQLLNEWMPDELVPSDWVAPQGVLKQFGRCAVGPIGKYVRFQSNKSAASGEKACRSYLNFASLNFLNLVGNEQLSQVAIKHLQHYGVGSCGPRGFYGTFDVHLQLEAAIAKFLDVEYAVVYSYGAATISSAIPSYAKRTDVIFADESVHHIIYQGIVASRSSVRYFRHNDMAHLEELLQIQAQKDAEDSKRAMLTRRFVVVEGLYMNNGDICPLTELVALKYKYKVRILLDETVSFGVLGATGRGLTEYSGVDIHDIDLLTGSLETALGVCGGFCAGTKYVAAHQTLSGQGYCFSASLPPMLAAAACTAVEMLASSDTMRDKHLRLTELANNVHRHFVSDRALSSRWRISGHPDSPLKHIQLRVANTLAHLETICELASNRQQSERGEPSILLTVARHINISNRPTNEPSIRLCLNCDLTDVELEQLFIVLKSLDCYDSWST